MENLNRHNAYSMDAAVKERTMLAAQISLCLAHYAAFGQYKNIVDGLGISLRRIRNLCDVPFLPARIFKEVDFCGAGAPETVLRSSGTSGSRSTLYLSGGDAKLQRKALYEIAASFLGGTRRPMVVLSQPERGKTISAKSAGALGFMLLGTHVLFADGSGVLEQVEEYAAAHGGSLLIYGTTVDVYTKLVGPNAGRSLSLPDATVILSGGWKNYGRAVSREELMRGISHVLGTSRIYDYYGMAEQTGSVYFCCEYGHYHCSDYSDILIRDPITFRLKARGERGLIQSFSSLPMHFPNNSILTEDIGEIIGTDDCRCGRKGKYFKIYGRLQGVSEKGCAYEQ